MTNRLIDDLDNFSVSESSACEVERCKQYLASYTNPITIITQNIRSLFKNFDNFIIFHQRLEITCDIIVLTECWLSKNSNLPQLSGYNVYNSTENHNQNDGIVVYVRNNLNITVEEPIILECNRLLIKIGSDLAILALYRPPSFKNLNTFNDSLNETLQSLSPVKNLILIGDININILPQASDSVAQEYLNICSFHGLLPAHTLPTHQSGSCLDHIMLKSNLPSIALVTNSTVTDHNAALLTFNRNIPNLTRTHVIAKLNVNKLEDDFANIDFDPVYNCDDLNNRMSYLVTTIQEIISKNTTYNRVSKKNYNIKPWITPGLIRCMRHRDKLHKMAKLNPHNSIYQLTYKRYRNYCNNILKKVKNNYDKNELDKAGTNSKKVWKYIKNVTYTNKRLESSSGLLQAQSSQVTCANNANEFFVNVGKNLAEKTERKSFHSPGIGTQQGSSTMNSFALLDTDEPEVEQIIMNLKDDCATGWDNISTKILKQFKHILVAPLTYIFRKCLAEGIFPKCLKKAVVVPVYKSGDKDQITNYRPISLLPTISKIL